MANTYIVSGSQFKPYTFDEMIKPHAIFTEAIDKAEENRSSLSVLGEAMESKITDLPEDAELRKAYETYMKEVGNMADAINNNDLKTAKSLGYKLRDLFTKTLAPAEEAYKRRVDYETKLRDLAIANPHLIVERPELSTSAFLGGGTPKNPTIINLNEIENEAMKSAAAASSRTFSRSGWYNTADERLIERVTKTGLNDVDFNNALFEVQNYIANNGKSSLSNNGILLYESLKDIINDPILIGLSTDDKLKVLNAATKGARIGFKYDEKVETHSNPAFKKSSDKKTTKLGRLGSDYFITADDVSNLKSSMLDFTGQKLSDVYKQLFKEVGEGANKRMVLQSYDELSSKKYNSDALFKSSKNFFTPAWTNFTPAAQSAMSGEIKNKYYNNMMELINTLDLKPNSNGEYTLEDIENALHAPDVNVRNRAVITSDSKGFEIIKSRIETGLRNNPEVKEVTGLREASPEEYTYNTNRRYKTTSGVEYSDLLDDKGNLNILSITLDYATGERTFIVKDTDGKVREFLVPDAVGFEADDYSTLQNHANMIHDAYRGYQTVYNPTTREYEKMDINDYLETFYPSITSVQDYIELIQNSEDDIFSGVLYYMGAENIME